MNAAWTTVASKSNNRSTTAISPQSNIGTTVNVLSTKPTGKDSTVVWDMDSHKGINGLRYIYIFLYLILLNFIYLFIYVCIYLILLYNLDHKLNQINHQNI